MEKQCRAVSEKKELMQAMIEKVELYPEKRKDGCWIRSITFKFPLPTKDGDVREFPLESLTTLESVVCLSREKANEPNQNFRIAHQGDAEHVLSLYQSAKSGDFCVWNDSYPSITEIEHDLETKNLHVMTDGSRIIGALSVVPENELDGFDCWSCKDGKEIARVVIDKAYQGHGLSLEMVQSIASILQKNGCKAIHLSVVKTNIPAYKTYMKAGFAVVGEAQMYGNDYYLMEKAIDTTSLPKRITDETIVTMIKQEE